MKAHISFRLQAVLLVFAVALPAFAYDYPLSPEAIRDAYLYGTGPHRLDANFLPGYTHTLPELKVTPQYYSVVKIETPYAQVAEHSREPLSYDAHDAVKDFFNKSMRFRILLDICYWPTQPKPVKIKVLQNHKEIVPRSVDREPYYAAQDPETYLPSIGEHVKLEFDGDKIDSSLMTIKIDTPAGQHAETTFDLSVLR